MSASLHPLALHRAQIGAVLLAWGMREDHAATVADVLAWADLHGIDSHGMSMLTSYDGQRRAGGLDLTADPVVLRETPVSALVDAQGNLGHPAALFSMRLAIEKAKAIGMASVAVRNSGHYGACGYYTCLATEEGLIAFTTTTTPGVTVAPTRGAEGRLGTDPWSMASPAAPDRPFLLDMATATVASGKVRNKANEGLSVPKGWIQTAQGKDTTDPLDLIERGGYLTSLGGTPEGASHKGYGLAAMARILSAGLAGSPMLLDRASKRRELAHFFLVLDPALFRDPDDYADAVAGFCDDLRATRPIDPARPVLVAGDPERAVAGERLRDGIPVAPGLLAKVRLIAQACGAEWVLDQREG